MSIFRPVQNHKSNTKQSFFKGFVVAAVVSLVGLSIAPASFAMVERIAPYACPDLTGDGYVDASDLAALAAKMEPAAYEAMADLNGDSHVTKLDASVLAGFFGRSGMECSNDAAWVISVACPDITRDGNVDGSDLSALAASMPPAAYDANADLNGDNVISSQDTSILEGYLGQTGFICRGAPTNPTIPEPSGVTVHLVPACPDITRDGYVDASDLAALAAAMPPTLYNWNADLNGDGQITQQDAQVWDGYRGQTGLICGRNFNGPIPVWTGPCPDLTGDGYADASDLSALAAALSPTEYSAMADLNNDGIVNNQDSSVLGGYLGQSGFTCNLPTPSPLLESASITPPPPTTTPIDPPQATTLNAPVESLIPYFTPAGRQTVATSVSTTPSRHLTLFQKLVKKLLAKKKVNTLASHQRRASTKHFTVRQNSLNLVGHNSVRALRVR